MRAKHLRLSGHEVVLALGRGGFAVARVRGRHYLLCHADGRATLVPVHAGEAVGPGLLGKILGNCGLDAGQFRALLKPRRRAERPGPLAANPPGFDAALLGGTGDDWNEFIEHSGQCLVVDWRSDEEGLTEALADILPNGWLAGEWVDAGDDCDLFVTYRGARHRIDLRSTPADRYRWLRQMNEIMASDFELRAFRHTLGDDTHCLLVGHREWWAAVEAQSPAAVARVFARVTRRSKFFG